MIEALLSALLSLLPPMEQVRPCLRETHNRIVQHATAASAQHGVPPSILLVVGYSETHLGCDRASGGNWGAPVSPLRRHEAGTAHHAARALATSKRVCGTWQRAINRFRCGNCNGCNYGGGYTSTYVLRMARRIHVSACYPIPRELNL